MMRNEKTGKVISENAYEIRKDMKRDRLRIVFHELKNVSMILGFLLTGLFFIFMIVISVQWMFGMLPNIYIILLGIFLNIILFILFSHLERWRGRVEFKRNEEKYWQG